VWLLAIIVVTAVVAARVVVPTSDRVAMRLQRLSRPQRFRV